MNTTIESLFVIEVLWSARPQTAHVIKVLEGRAWATLVGDLEADNPDHVMLNGSKLKVSPGQHLVVEAWPRHDNDALKVIWQPLGQNDIELTAYCAESTSA